MLLENYTGDSKVLKAIAHILNRKAPLPLDGDGDADFGTNGQVLKTDGTGNTYWDDESSGGDSVEWTQIQASGTKIAEIDINGTSQDVYAPNGGGGGGGHTIIDPSGTSMTQRDGLQFLDAHLADDSVNDRTKVEVVKIVTENEFNALDETDPDNDGIYLFEKSGGTPIDLIKSIEIPYANFTWESSAKRYSASVSQLSSYNVIGFSVTATNGAAVMGAYLNQNYVLYISGWIPKNSASIDNTYEFKCVALVKETA